MKNIFTSLLYLIAFSTTANEVPSSEKKLAFKENKGQISDQFNNPRPDVLFTGSNGDITFHMKKDGISYQLFRVDKWSDETKSQFTLTKKIRRPEQSTSYRIDINWLNSSVEEVEKSGELPGYDNYYLPVCPNGATFIKSYSDIIYKNIYDGISLHYYNKQEQLKYDYIVSPHSDYKQIKLEINGADKIYLNEKKELVIQTPLGSISEQVPIVMQGGKKLNAQWEITDNIVSFEIKNINHDLPFTIDPLVRTWGTYYGGNGDDVPLNCHSDNLGDIYIAGYTNSTSGLATSGAHQTVYTGSTTTICGNSDAFLVKFNTNGVRLWGTYYGDDGTDEGRCSGTDAGGNVFLVGAAGAYLHNANTFSTPGCYQPTFAGTVDAFIAKFNSNGVRIWGTYYGSVGLDEAQSCVIDNAGNIYFTGVAGSDTNPYKIVTPGAYQTTYGGGNGDAFYAKFDTNGNRLYATYFGGAGDDISYSSSMDSGGNLFISGTTTSSLSGISTSGSHQTIFGGGNNDAFLAKFNSSGAIQWGTYYGGNDLDESFSCATDALGNVFITGYSGSPNNISTPGCHQSSLTIPNSEDAILIKFTTNGVRLWGTYYGGGNGEIGRSCIVNKISNDVYITGETNSYGVIGQLPTAGCYQDTLGGIDDAFLAKFNSSGVIQWGTYYGGNWEDWGFGVTLDPIGNIYITGFTDSTSPNSISTPGCFQPTKTFAYDIFLAKFFDSGTTAIVMNEQINSSVHVYPNPTTNFINILETNLEKPKLEIINSLGQTIFKSEFKNQIDVSELANGFYTLLLKDNSGSIITKKFVKE